MPCHIKQLSDYLRPKVRELAEDINGNHVIQKILSCWTPEHNQFIYDAMINQCVEIACHKHGCCVMQKCIDGANQKQKIELTSKIAEHTQIFVRNPYGNYVVQYVLELKLVEINKLIG
jgi:pumilio RNA-binding family